MKFKKNVARSIVSINYNYYFEICFFETEKKGRKKSSKVVQKLQFYS